MNMTREEVPMCTWLKSFSVCCLVWLVSGVHGFSPSVITVPSPWGLIQGLQRVTSTGFSFSSFEGIPYALPPVGPLRFARPVPSQGSLLTAYKAIATKPSCYSFVNPGIEAEDCLYLDLYVPEQCKITTGSTLVLPSHPEPLSVMVFIHGGGFVSASGRLNMLHLMEKGNVIVAFLQYRLGPLGFLSTGDGELKGNYGLWDQHLALKWIKDNVAAFGGDAANITIFGESAGSASVSYHALSLHSKDLFKRAVMLSGAATSTWALNREPSVYTFELAQRLACGARDPYYKFVPRQSLVACLRQASAKRIDAVATKMWKSGSVAKQVGDFLFVPVVDGEFVVAEPQFLLKNKVYLNKLGVAEKDFFINVLNNEGALLTTNPNVPQPPALGDFLLKEMIPKLLKQRYGLPYPQETPKVINNFYTSLFPLDNAATAFGDPAIVIPSLEFAQAVSGAQVQFKGSGDTFFSFFDYCPSFSPVQCMMHGLDMVFIFPWVPFTDATDSLMSDMFNNFLTSFAKSGQPSHAALASSWPRYTEKTGYKFVRVAPLPTIHENLFPLRQHMWLHITAAMIEITPLLSELYSEQRSGNKTLLSNAQINYGCE